MENNSPLTNTEQLQLANLLKRVQWPLHPEVFDALMNTVVSVPIELAVFNDNGHILMMYRKDHAYEGWHIPGTVLRHTEDVSHAIERLLTHEVKMSVTPPVQLGYTEIKRGNAFGEDPNRHQISLLHVCWTRGTIHSEHQFFPPTRLPEETLSHHKKLIQKIMERLTIQ